jgi:hypothetical protein
MHKIRFKWVDNDIIYYMSKAIDPYNGPLVLYPFILSDNQLFELNHLCLEVHCIRYELRLFMAKAFPLLKLIMTSTGWGAVSTIFLSLWYDPDSNPRPHHPDTDVLLLSKICWVWIDKTFFFKTSTSSTDTSNKVWMVFLV